MRKKIIFEFSSTPSRIINGRPLTHLALPDVKIEIQRLPCLVTIGLWNWAQGLGHCLDEMGHGNPFIFMVFHRLSWMSMRLKRNISFDGNPWTFIDINGSQWAFMNFRRKKRCVLTSWTISSGRVAAHCWPSPRATGMCLDCCITPNSDIFSF